MKTLYQSISTAMHLNTNNTEDGADAIAISGRLCEHMLAILDILLANSLSICHYQLRIGVSKLEEVWCSFSHMEQFFI